jgi:lysophospholipase L1-like esterase
MKILLRSLVISVLLAWSAFAQQTIVTCVGNSITAGGYPELLEDSLGSQFLVGNYGVSGTTMLKNGDLPYWDQNAYQQALNSNPDIVTIMLGTNDSKMKSEGGGQPMNWGLYSHEFRDDAAEMATSFSSLPSNPIVILCFPPPAFEGNYEITDSIIRDSIIPIIQSVADSMGLPIIDNYTPMLDSRSLFPDEIHPNDEGNRMLASQFNAGILAAMNPVVKGCMNIFALNYNPMAEEDDGSCVFDSTTGLQDFSGGSAFAEPGFYWVSIMSLNGSTLMQIRLHAPAGLSREMLNSRLFPGRSPHYGMYLIKLKDTGGVEETIPYLFR